MTLPAGGPSRVIGRYAIYDEIASGGMASVHYGRLHGTAGFSRTVAIKRLHAHLAKDPEFVEMFLDEARVAARIRHPNVVPMLDVVNTDGEIFLVMEYVAGESLARLVRTVRSRGERIPAAIACSLVVGVLRGLHAAHEATDEHGEHLCIVHRDVSPQNIMVGRDGVAHVLDFGVAKAAGQLQTTREGQIKGKVAYMPPEQVRGGEVTRAVDIHAAGVVLWELLVGDRLFGGENEANVLERVLFAEIPAPSSKGALPDLDEVVMRALARAPESRFATAREMARAIEASISVAPASEVTEWLETLAGDALLERQRLITAIESGAEDAGPRTRKADDAARRDADPTSVPSTTGDAASRGERSRRSVVVLAAALGLAALVVAFGVRARSRAIPAPILTAVTVVAPPPAAQTAAVSAQLSAMPAAAPTPVPPAQSPPPPIRSPARPRGGPRHDLPAGAGPTPPATRPGCSPPYTIDADGVKQYKVECL